MSRPRSASEPAYKRYFRRGVPGCPECGGEGRVRRQPLKKDGMPTKRQRWEMCLCAVDLPVHRMGKSPGRPSGGNACVVYGAELSDKVDWPAGVTRPRTRGECRGGPRPCPFVGCRYHLFLEVVSSGHALRLPRGLAVPPEALPPEASCALDLAEARADEGYTLEEIAELLGVTRERVRQVQDIALRKMLKRLPLGQAEVWDLLCDLAAARDRGEEGRS
jgi:hypothetical protein